MSMIRSKFSAILNSFCLVILTYCNDSQGINFYPPYPQDNDGRGFGSHIHWIDVNKAEEAAKVLNKPIMLIIHRSWCSSCLALKPKFAASREIAELSQHFVMVNASEEKKFTGKKYSPDGEYYPRILFFGPGGHLEEDFYNKNGDPSYKYYYSDYHEISKVMKKVYEKFSSHDEL